MLLTDLWQWWYMNGWMSAAKGAIDLLKRQSRALSVPILLRTLFSPWKQTINIAGPNTPIQVRLQWWVGNQISRFIGFIIRIIVLLIAGIVLGTTAIFATILLLSWFFIPVLSVGLLVGGLVAVWM